MSSIIPFRALGASRPARTPWLVVALLALALAGMSAAPPAQALALLVLAPVLEEVVFRAGLQSFLLQHLRGHAAFGAHTANLLTAVAFAAAHVAVRPSLLAALTLMPALLVGALYQRQRRLVPCITLHAAFNAIWLLWAGRSIDFV
jgi:membrane protease YdiL (CAAX protease family)